MHSFFLNIFSIVCSICSHTDVILSAPGPPTNVRFSLHSDSRGAPVITGTWSDEDRCVLPCGYVVTCCIPGAGVEINTTVWESELAHLDPIRVNVTGVDPATQYVCKVASFNAHGLGSTGSNVFVETMEIGRSVFRF